MIKKVPKKLGELNKEEKRQRAELLNLMDKALIAEIERIKAETEMRIKQEKKNAKRGVKYE